MSEFKAGDRVRVISTEGKGPSCPFDVGFIGEIVDPGFPPNPKGHVWVGPEGYREDIDNGWAFSPDSLEYVGDAVNHPAHYTSHPSGVECIQITEHMSFNLGNAFKYIWRADLKNDAIEDLKKAVWYVEREIAKREKEK